jgi:uncharacterized protein YdaU (DUF1376 family)
MKDTFYFSHDYNPRGDEKIQKLIFKLGWEGYGLYWALIEMLYQNEGYVEYECDRIAFELRTDSETINSIIKGFDLFNMQGKNFFSKSVLHRLAARKGKSEKARQSAKARWDKGIEGDANAMRTHNERNAIKERKGKENKIKETKEKKATPLFSEEVENCYLSCLNHFEAHLHPEKSETWKTTIKQLNEIDKIPFDHIVDITKKIRQDGFWGKNFLTLNKLRKKNKDGIMYVVVFNEYLKTTYNGKHGQKSRFGKVSEEFVAGTIRDIADLHAKHFGTAT